MAYIGRGFGPLASGGANNNFNGGNFRLRTHYYVVLDDKYRRIQMLISLFILALGAITYIFTYKSTIVDPIESMKNLLIKAHLITIGILVIIDLIMHVLSKNAKILIKNLIVIFSISIISMLIFFGIKLKKDAEYTKNKFEQIYIEQCVNENSNNKSKIDVGMNGISVKTEKDYYIDECVKLYKIFKIKTCSTLGLHFLLNLLLMYQISRISKVEDKKDRINNDDLILFDEEQNVKY